MSFNINNNTKASSGIIPVTNPLLQSNCLYLQAAGSKGKESTKGIHLRWTLKGPLAEHLPKGKNYDGQPKGFNKENDFISIYRTRYEPIVRSLYLTDPPTTVVDSEALWLYGNTEQGMFRVYFRNKNKYNEVVKQLGNSADPMQFFAMYGSNLIEVEAYEKLFFATKLVTDRDGFAKTEVLSVETNMAGLPKNVTFRRQISDFSQKIFAENGRSVRFIPNGMIVTQIEFEFYEDVAYKRNWESLGNFGLTTDDDEVLYRRLEPRQDKPVHAAWARYNDEEFVNIKNYVRKWGDMPQDENTIRHSVKSYLNFSNDPSNPLAIEHYYLNDDTNDSNPLEFSHFSNLQMAAIDYHIARMLGLGHLDLADEVEDGSQYMYAAHYVTLVNLKDQKPGNKIDHLSISLPTSLEDERLSLPVRLKKIVPGMVSADPTAGTTMSGLTDADGYTHDGTGRYLSLMMEEITPDEPANSPFYYTSQEFDMSTFTYPVSVGIEYKTKGDTEWTLPELPNDPGFLNVYSDGHESHNETVAIAIPDFGNPAFVHKETRSGIHIYGSYGVNWFSRATSTAVTLQIESTIKPANTLLPPSSVSAFLVQKEKPLLLTSDNEQKMYDDNTNTDKTLVRLTMEYDASQDMISYQKAINGEELSTFKPLPDNEELFADKIEVFYRPETIKQVFGMIDTVADLPGNPLVSVITTKALPLSSNGVNQNMNPTILPASFPNYIGGVFTVGADDYIIHNIVQGSNPNFPIFHIMKMQSGNAFGQNIPIPFDPANFSVPAVNASFMVSENLQNPVSWGSVNPHSFKVQIGNNWPIHTEEITIESGQAPDITYNTYFRKYRGINKSATIKRFNENGVPFTGLYEINFPGYTLNNHPQFTDVPGKDSVQWYRGSVRVSVAGQPGAEKRILKVIRIDNIGTGNLRVYALDESHTDTNPLQPDAPRTEEVNFYPGYRAYLFQNAPSRLTNTYVVPQEPDVLEKYSIFGTRSISNTYAGYSSRISIPTMMFGRRIEAPATPEQPLGSKYATRPDSFGRSSYAFTTQFTHRPFSVMYLRSNDDILLSSLYNYTKDNQQPATNSIESIREANSDEFFNTRLLELANAKYNHATKLFTEYNGFRLPLPDNKDLFKNINLFIQDHNTHFQENINPVTPSQMTNLEHQIIPAHPSGKYSKVTFYDFIKQTIRNSFVPLTEIPILYQHVKGGDYQPVPKAQVIRGKNGAYLNPTSPEFDMAPMMKIVGNNKTTFVDFTLDGASTSVYFYAVKEINAQLVQGDMSTAVGPVAMVNSFPLKTPEIKSVIPVLQNEELGISPKMQVTINSYKKIYNVKKAKLYRALNMQDAVSVRTMKLVKEIDLEAEGVLDHKTWTLEDNFAEFYQVPFSDPLYYRVTVEAEVEYAEANYSGNTQSDVIVTEYAPSEASKLMITTITENVLPISPSMTFIGNYGRLGWTNVNFSWAKPAYKAKYHVYKMSTQGNWTKIKTVENVSTSPKVSVKLALKDTDWGSGTLLFRDGAGNQMSHHFKVVTENTAGMLSTDENILTINGTLSIGPI